MIQGEQKKIILVAATAWGKVGGGINSFNTEFCKSLGSIVPSSFELVCIVYNASVHEIDEASLKKVRLISLEMTGDKKFFTYDKLESAIKNSFKRVYGTFEILNKVVLVLVHDISTGELLDNECLLFPNAKWAAIHHMNYQAYKHLKDEEELDDIDNKIMKQSELFTNVDYVFAVGPLLTKLIGNLLKQSKVKKFNGAPIELIPGIDVLESNFIPGSSIEGITFGRLDNDNDTLKLSSLALKSWVKVIRKAQDKNSLLQARLKIIGFAFNKKDFESIKKIQSNISDIVDTSYFTNDKKRLEFSLKNSSLAFMLSRHEGFGLTGWEAIGAETPLIVSQESGLWILLNKLGLDKYVFGIKLDRHRAINDSFNEDEVEKVNDSVQAYIDHIQDSHNKAKKLQEELKNIYSWEKTANTFLTEVKPYLESCNAGTLETQNTKLDLKQLASNCTVYSHSFIISHRTQTFQPINPQRPYDDMLIFLEKFADHTRNITNNDNPLKRTLLIFVLDYCGDNHIDAQAIYNQLFFQSFLKAIMLWLPGKRSSSQSPGTITKEFFKHIPMLSRNSFTDHRCLMKELAFRVVIICKNYKSYMDKIIENEKEFSKQINDNSYNIIFNQNLDKQVLHKEDLENTPKELAAKFKDMYPNFDEHYVLFDEIPPLDYLKVKGLYDDVLKSTCLTGPENLRDKAFGLFSTVKFKNIEKGEIHDVTCYYFDKNGKSSILPYDESHYESFQYCLDKESIKESMSAVNLAACHFLFENLWSKERYNNVTEIYDKKDSSEIMKAAYYKLLEDGFSFFTLQQFLNIPSLFNNFMNIN